MFRLFANLWRLARVGATFARTGALSRIFEEFDPPPYARTVLWIITLPMGPFGLKGDASLPPVPRAINALGPAYIKFGQILSTRPDIVGADLARQLRLLQDALPPFPVAEARAIVEAELGKPVDLVFSQFDPPIAAASIAQVHAAITRDTGRKVAVKVLRPNVERQFRADIKAFYFIARTLEWLIPSTRRLRPTAVVAHFDSVVSAEMDLRLEASSAAEYRENTKDDPLFKVPAIFWEMSARRVMTLEWVDGAPLGDNDALHAMGVNLPDLAVRVCQAFLRHALIDGFFHADMHQGNLKVRADGAVLALDFGVMGRLDALTRRYYAEILYGFAKRDYRRVAEVHFEAGYVPADRDIDAFAQALRSIGEPIFGMDVSRISMARLLAHLFETTERFGMRTRTELLLLQRSMVVVEGVARSLDPQCNMWNVIRPVAEVWMKDNLGPKAALRDLRTAAVTIARYVPRLPGIAEQFVIAAQREPGPPPQPAPAGGGIAAGLVGGLLGGLLGGAGVAGAIWAFYTLN
ncbi:MAG: 2-polyprenylphenol 6-hydroxylase [Rubrimonas sp.]|uniref:2-polyprenylphenol 6-hydroxylase n=1 Tax=Rubrimonas sp. TaxID=2036015 RepID=UPI002FDE4D33